MELSKFNVVKAAGEGAFLHLKNPFTGEKLFESDGETPFGMTILGNDAAVVQEAVKTLKKRHVEGEISEEEMGLRISASCICGWSEEMEVNGKPFPYTPENAYKLLSMEDTSWVGEQILPFSLRRRNFVKNVKDD